MAKQGGTVVEVAKLPECNFCTERAEYDFKTKTGPWAFGCKRHWERWRAFKVLGIGMGQKLEVRK